MSARAEITKPARILPQCREKTGRIDRAVILSPFFWNFRDDMWQATHHVARAIARHVPTLFVEPPAQWNPASEEFRLRRILSCCFGRRTEFPEQALTVFRRRGFPLGRLAAFRNAQGKSNARALAKILRQFSPGKTVLWHSFPYWSEQLVESVECDLLVYHCLDYSPRAEERRLVGRADVVFCVSQALVGKYTALNRRTFLLPNGVDLSLFDPDLAARSARPADLPRHGRIIGFAGYLNCHADLELIAAVAKAHPRDQVVLIGPLAKGNAAPRGRQREALDGLKSLPNVSLLGFRPPHALPAYLYAFDVCLIPLLRDEFNRERDPMKFYQYMAMGKPVVSTPIGIACSHRDLCRVAETRGEFIEAVGEALLHEAGESVQRARRALAKEHSWPALVDRAWQIIERQSQIGESPR